jgi:hypothetical protein
VASPRSRHAARLRARRRRSQQRARRLAVLGILGVLGLVTLLLTAFGSSAPQEARVTTAAVLPSGRPEPEGHDWDQLGAAGGGTEVLDVGASAGTDVYSPVDGSVAAISDQIVDGRPIGSRIDIRPSSAPSVIVSLTNLRPDPSLTVGVAVAASSSKLGTIADIARVEEQSLADVTNDEGNNVAIEVHASPSTLP